MKQLASPEQPGPVQGVPGHMWKTGHHWLFHPLPLPIPPSLSALCPGQEVAPNSSGWAWGWRPSGLGTLHSGSWMAVGAMRVVRVSQAVLTLYTREGEQQLCLQPTGRPPGGGNPADTAGVWLLSCPVRHWGEGSRPPGAVWKEPQVGGPQICSQPLKTLLSLPQAFTSSSSLPSQFHLPFLHFAPTISSPCTCPLLPLCLPGVLLCPPPRLPYATSII